MATEEKQLRELLTSEAARERRAVKRSSILIGTIALVGLLWLGFSAYRVINLQREWAKLSTDIREQRRQLDDLQSKKDLVMQQLDEARVALEAAKTTLNNVASDVKNPNKQAELQKTLRTVTNASKQISGGKNSNPKTNETTLSPTLIPAPMNYGGVNYGDVARKPTPRPESFETPNNGPVDYTKVFLPGEVDRQARILSKPIPDYTEEARKNNVQGVVELRVVLAASGEVSNIRVVQRLPFGLSERAVVAAKQLKFTPAMKDGRAVSQSQVLDYKFGLY